MQKEYWINVYEGYRYFICHSKFQAKYESLYLRTLYRIHVKMKPAAPLIEMTLDQFKDYMNNPEWQDNWKPAGVAYTTEREMKVERLNWPVIKMEW
jgi:hypothetical protein